jgi:phosphate transport system protein
MMRSRYDEQLSILNSELIEMGALVEYAITKAVTALEVRDLESAKEVIRNDRVIDEKEKEIESLCL